MNKGIILLLNLALVGCASIHRKEEIISQLVATPDKYDQHRIITHGYLNLHFEGSVICNSKEFSDINRECIQLIFDTDWEFVYTKYSMLQDKLVLVDGKFKKEQIIEEGKMIEKTKEGNIVIHFGPYFHKIENIVNLEVITNEIKANQ